MKITKIIIRKLIGTINFDGQFWEERLVRPIDIYPEYEMEQDETKKKKKGKFSTESIFIEIYTDNDLSGIAGPIDEQQAFIIEKNLSGIILGKDPLAIELLWDQMHRLSVHGRQGITMQAISAIDCALWDIKGKYFNTPIYNLIGGPTRNLIPAYASMLGFNVTDMSLVAERALMYKEKGFDAQKWFFRYGPMSGKRV